MRAPLALAIVLALSSIAHAEGDKPVTLDTVEVTTSKAPQSLRDTAASVQIVTGEELRARGATELRTALSLVPGVDIAPGGDGGPASSVPALWGLREFDAFLLVVDGVPWGGAFNPALATLDLANVERIEVLKGAAPVSYGATSFVGVIHVIHYAAGEGPARVEAGVGSRGSARVALALPLSNDAAGMRSSVLLDGEKNELKPDRTGWDRAHVLYRLAGGIGDGLFTLDLDGTVLHQDPTSPHPREAGRLTPRFPLDANVNPRDARQDENRTQLALGYVVATSLGDWTTRFAAARTDGDVTKGFLREDFEDDGVTHNADGFRQSKESTEIYFDTHVLTHLTDRTDLVWGIDHMYGDGSQHSANFEYGVLPNGHNAPNSHDLPTDEGTKLKDRRNFTGAYLDLHHAVSDNWRIEAGLRLNRTRETREGIATDFTGGSPDVEEFEPERRSDTRLSGALGTSFNLWRDGQDGVTAFANYRSAYKPAAIDFGPEAESEILKPETARSGEIGLKGEHGRFEWEASAFRMNFKNLVVATAINGQPALANAGSEHFKGAEIEARYAIDEDLSIKGTYAYHDARFADYAQIFGDATVPTQLRGKRLEMSPQNLAGLGLLYAPAQGFNANVVAGWVGSRYLNKRNTSLAGSYTTVDAGVGYRWDAYEVRVDGTNLTDRRDPVAESELGDAQYYRLAARSYWLSLRYSFGK